MTFEELNAKLAEILGPSYRFRKGYMGQLWITGPNVNQSCRLAKDGMLIRTRKATITTEKARLIGQMVKEYRECLK